MFFATINIFEFIFQVLQIIKDNLAFQNIKNIKKVTRNLMVYDRNSQ